MDNIIKHILDELYDDNMWVTAEHCSRIHSLYSDRCISEEDLLAIIDKAAPEIKKRWCKPFDRMGNKKEYYRIAQRIFRANSDSMVSIGCKYTDQKLCGTFIVYITEFFDYEYRTDVSNYASVIKVKAKNNGISFSYCFPREDVYAINVYYLLDDQEHLLLSEMVYALEDDLADLLPFKADLHMHTTESDGYETPERVAISARKHGMDIIAVTDHNAFSGSLKAKQFIEKNNIHLTVITGEEYSLEYSPMHILALGTAEPVARKYLKKEILNSKDSAYKRFEKDVVSMNKSAYIATQILLSEVRRMGGISILAHPFWKPIENKGYRMDTPESFYKDLSAHRLFDGIEIVSGSQDGECNTANLQNALASSLFGGYENITVTGITDSHYYSSDPISGKHFTIILSTNNSKESIIESIRSGLCVAVEMVNGVPMCYGKYRLIKFAQFLVKYFFPEKDKEAFIEASLAEKILMV